MGFFSSLTGGLLGGSKSSSSSSSGYGALPAVAQEAMDEVTKQGRALLLGNTGANLFTPLPQTASETQAFNLMQMPNTQSGVSELVSRYQNPYLDSLINDINRQSQGEYSLYKQALSGAGQMGSNREFVNAAAADEARMRAIEQAQRESYNTALSTGLGQNQQSIANLLTQGEFARGIEAQTQQAPLAALQAMAQLLGVYPASSEGTSKSSSSEGIGGLLQGVGALSKLKIFSDIRLKDNITKVGEKDGLSIYEYNYKGDNTRFIGVMAQEVAKHMPDAVSVEDGYLKVDYSKLNIQMGVV